MQYSFVYTVQMQKKISPQPEKAQTLCYNTKEQIPPCRRVFQKLDECWEAPELGV